MRRRPASRLIHVTGTIYCSPGEVCPDLAMLWTLRVIVTRSASSPFTLRLTSLDFENTYDVRPGDRFILTLGPTAKYEWGEPTATVSGVVRRVAGRKGATAAGLFIATAPGRHEVGCHADADLSTSLLVEAAPVLGERHRHVVKSSGSAVSR